MSAKDLPHIPESLPNQQIPILVVSNSPKHSDRLELMLSRAGFSKIHLAATGKEALTVLESRKDVGVVILDSSSELNIQEVYNLIAHHEASKHVPVITSGFGDFYESERALVLHNDHADTGSDFASRPANELELTTHIHSALSLYRERVTHYHDTAALAASEQKFRIIFNRAPVGIAHVDDQGEMVLVNERLAQMLGYSSDELAQINFESLCTDNWEEHRKQLQSLHDRGENYYIAAMPLQHKNQTIIWANMTVAPLRNPQGQLDNFIHFIEDITHTKEAEERLHYLANYDVLTGLPNRMLFNDRLKHALAHCERYGDKLAVLFIDLDRFKVINDSLGHRIGDSLLKSVAKRLARSLRSSDTVARWGGDEFAIMLGEVDGAQDAAAASRRVLELCSEPFVLEDHEIFATASMGIGIYPKDGRDVQSLVSNADTAMHRAKEQGVNSYRFYSTEMNAMAMERLRLESDLRRAIQREELFLSYQPKINLLSGRVVGAEALLRWDHPQRGVIYPDEFITLAEETGLIVPIGEWVLRSACRQNRSWLAAGLPAIRIGVNVSTRQFKKRNLAEMVDHILHETDLTCNLLELEITESVMMEDMEHSIRVMCELSTRGIQFSVDDFGTGYSSLVYLKKFPVNTLKIDQSLVRNTPNNPADEAIVLAIISLAKSLKLKTVAEGIETTEQLQFFREHGCDEAQGYLISPAVTPERMSELLRAEILVDRLLIS